MALNKDEVLKWGFENAVKASIEVYLTDKEILKVYSDQMVNYGKEMGLELSKTDVEEYISLQLKNFAASKEITEAPVETRF